MRLMLCLLPVALLAACGGGGGSAADGGKVAQASVTPAAGSVASDAKVSLQAVDATAAATSTSTSWTLCASEGQTCVFSGTRAVRYGTETANVTGSYTSQVSCTNAVFGDPAYGIAKSCWYSSDTTTPPPDSTWVLCANESQFCSFSGTRAVRYGTATNYYTGTYTDGVSCANAVFGDPAYGIAKSCWYAGTATTTPAPGGNWVVCANESQFCSFSGTHAVRYGSATSYYTGTYTDGVACANSVFGDPAYGIVKTCSYLADAVVPTPTPTDPTGASGSNPPIVFNASASAHAGDIVSLQGVNFGASPSVYFDGAPATALEIVNRVGTGWLAVQIPASAQGALVLRIASTTGTSAQIKLNAARPLHLDAMQLVPGGAFRVFGRSLLLAGSVPTVTVDGVAATVDLSKSDEYMLSVTAPSSLSAKASVAILVDNGNGTGAAQLDRTIEVATSGSGDPFGLGVGWGAGFSAISNNTIYAASDPRLGTKVRCDGSSDDSGAIRAAVDLGVAVGGAVVQLPAGRCLVGYGFELKSRVVVLGAGKAATEIVYASNYAVYGVGIDLSGIGDLTLTNSGASTEGPMVKDSSRIFFRNLRITLNTSRQMYLSGNRNFVIQGSDVVQTGSISEQGPYILNDSAGLVFEGNTTRWVNGAPTFGRIHDSYLHASRFTRDATVQDASGTVHSMAIDFAHRVAVIGNTFDVVNGPVTNKNRNDGETILTEGGGAARTENLGTVVSATATTIADPSNSFQLDPFGLGTLPENYGVAIVGGTGAGQTRRLVSANGSTLTMDRAWDVVPDASSHYATFVWGLEKSLIKDNVLSQNPRGIWLYQTAIRDVDVIGNTITEGGGIFLRSYQNLAAKYFMPIYGVVIAKNRISNTTRNWMSYLEAVFVNTDARAFGIAMLGIEMRSNELTANQPNVTSVVEDYASSEGFQAYMRVENYSGYESSTVPRLLGTILTNNLCTYCNVGVQIGTGDGGTTIVNTRLVNVTTPLTDTATTVTSEKSTDTVFR